jgi:D-threo-aldose 1-dehydrogenase
MSTPPLALRRFGATDSRVTPIFGPVPASTANLFGNAEKERAVATVEAAFDSTVNFIDTSNGYGEDGTISAVVRRRGGYRMAYRGTPSVFGRASRTRPAWSPDQDPDSLKSIDHSR